MSVFWKGSDCLGFVFVLEQARGEVFFFLRLVA